MDKLKVYLEIGKKRVFAGALDWPGWARSGKDEDAALQALLDYGPRYTRVLRNARLNFHPPSDTAAFKVVERLEGNATTDFGAPGIAPAFDAQPVDEAELRRLQSLLKACWRTFDAAVKAAQGKELTKGPRGGGRELDKIIEHVVGADEGYLNSIGWKLKGQDKESAPSLESTRQAVLKGLAASAHSELPTYGPRGGVYWSPRYFCRRVAWHVLDHAWEIEDRAV